MKLPGSGVLLAVDNLGTYVNIAQVQDLQPPGISVDEIEVTTRDSTGLWREFIPGLKDGGEVKFTLMFDPDLTTHLSSGYGMVALAVSPVVKNFRITFNDGAPAQTWIFAAFVTSFEPDASLEDALMADVTLKVTGPITPA